MLERLKHLEVVEDRSEIVLDLREEAFSDTFMGDQ